MKDASPIFFYFPFSHFSFPERKRTKRFLSNLFLAEGYGLRRVSYIFCDDDYLFSLNRQFLNHDTYTDTITFPLSDKDQPLEGEIYISIERVKENSKKFKTLFREELCRVIIHSSLHLCGYSDKSLKSRRNMQQKENWYLSVSRETNISTM
jgi:rRNA maturation RNase YbeY